MNLDAKTVAHKKKKNYISISFIKNPFSQTHMSKINKIE